MTAPRDCSAMERAGRCVICGLEFCPENSDPSLDEIFIGLHVVDHLASGEAIVVKVPGQPDKVVPRDMDLEDRPDMKSDGYKPGLPF